MMMKWIIITAIALTMVLMIIPSVQAEDDFLVQRGNIVYFNFEGLNQSDVVDWSFDFGDGSGSKSNGVHVYQEDGTYLASLWILNSEGNTTRIDRWITIGTTSEITPAHSIRHPYIDNGALYLPFKPDLIITIPFGAFIICGVIMALSHVFEIKTPINEKDKIPISMILILFGLWIGFWGVSFP